MQSFVCFLYKISSFLLGNFVKKMKGKKSISEEKKWQIVAYHQLGMKESKICSLVNVSPTCIKTTVRNWTNNGSVRSLSGAGRPRKIFLF
jgi:transposase